MPDLKQQVTITSANLDPIVSPTTRDARRAALLFGFALTALVQIGAPQPAAAFGPVKVNKDLKHFPLRAAELGRLGIAAGWVDGEPNSMVFDVGNRLEQPVFCATVEIELNAQGKKLRALIPSLYIPPAQSRRGRLADVSKKDVRSFKLVCTCLRKSEKGPCEHPLVD